MHHFSNKFSKIAEGSAHPALLNL